MTKYGAIPTEVDGIRFASKAEARRYQDLRLMEMGGLIADLTLQPRLPLVVNGVKIGTYVADFRYLDHGHGKTIWEDVKGVETPVFRIKRKLVKALHGIDVRVVS